MVNWEKTMKVARRPIFVSWRVYSFLFWLITFCCVEIYNIGLPWWLNSKESACQRRGNGFDPWSRKIPHAAEKLSPCATAVEPVLYSLGATATHPHAATTEARMPRAYALQQESLHSATREPLQRRLCTTAGNSPCSHEDPAQPKINKHYEWNT